MYPNQHQPDPRQTNTTYLGVEPLAPPTPQPEAPQSAPIPEWDQYVAPPAIAQAQPAHIIDARPHREEQERSANVRSVLHPQAAPAPQVPPGYGVTAPRVSHSAQAPQPAPRPAPTSVAAPVSGPGYSPFRDDQDAYQSLVEHRGITYYVKYIDDVLRQYVDGFTPRFLSDPRHFVVDARKDENGWPVEVLPRPIALEEVTGGELEWYGERVNLPEGAIYTQFPRLQGQLQVRPLTVEEAENTQLLLGLYPSAYKKFLAAQEGLFDFVLDRCLVAWTIGGAEVNEVNIRRLTPEVKRIVFLRTGANSVFGLNEDDFFRQRDSSDSQR